MNQISIRDLCQELELIQEPPHAHMELIFEALNHYQLFAEECESMIYMVLAYFRHHYTNYDAVLAQRPYDSALRDELHVQARKIADSFYGNLKRGLTLTRYCNELWSKHSTPFTEPLYDLRTGRKLILPEDRNAVCRQNQRKILRLVYAHQLSSFDLEAPARSVRLYQEGKPVPLPHLKDLVPDNSRIPVYGPTYKLLSYARPSWRDGVLLHSLLTTGEALQDEYRGRPIYRLREHPHPGWLQFRLR